MTDRAELKARAKKAFEGKYFRVFAACLAVTAVVSLSDGIVSFGSGTFVFIGGIFGGISDVLYDGGLKFAPAAIALLAVLLSGIVSVVGIMKNAFIVNPVNVGMKAYFLRNRENKENFGDIFSVFGGGKYLKTVGTVFVTKLFISLWSLLFVIPGIYHLYVYWAVEYICAENPDISSAKAREVSRKMTDGHKFEIFVTELSFIGWRILGSLVIFGNLFVNPYVNATYAELYSELRRNALADGKISPEDVGLQADVCADGETVWSEF